MAYYGIYSPAFLLHFVAVIAVNYLFAVQIQRTRSKTLVGIAVAANILHLAFFKYFNSVFALVAPQGAALPEWFKIVMPLAISFYTFQFIAFLVDVYRSNAADAPPGAAIKPEPGRYFLFMLFFPHLISGPILRAADFYRQIGQEVASRDMQVRGLYLVALGLIKKLFIADVLGYLVNPVFKNPAEYGSADALAAILGYTAQLYCDFSGFIDIARGIGKLFGYSLPQNFNSPYFSNYNFNEDNISERYTETIQLNREKGKRLQYASFDFSKYLSAKGPRLQNGLFYLKVRGVRKKKQDQETENEGESDEVRVGKLEDKRLVLVSDLGILVKAARSGTRDVFVQSFAQGFPVAGVEVSVIGKNGMAVATQTTDANGHVTLANLSEFTREKAPVAFIAKAGSDLSFMPFARDDRKLDFSRFDVGGLQGADSRDKLTAFIFSDRGMYRPGDEIRAGLIIKSGDWKRNLSGLPVEVSILDPRGIEVFSRLRPKNRFETGCGSLLRAGARRSGREEVSGA